MCLREFRTSVGVRDGRAELRGGGGLPVRSPRSVGSSTFCFMATFMLGCAGMRPSSVMGVAR